MKTNFNLNTNLIGAFALLLIWSCSEPSHKSDTKNSNVEKTTTTQQDTVSFNYFLSTFSKGNFVPEYLWKKYFPESVKKILLDQKSTVGSVTVYGMNYRNINFNHVVTFETGSGTACEVVNIMTFGKDYLPISHVSFYSCDCNESYCEGETIEFINDSIIKVKKSIWGGEADEEEEFTTKDTTLFRKVIITKEGKIEEYHSNNNIPKGFVLFDSFSGDLNKDEINDTVWIVKATDQTKIINDQYRGELDRNRRGIIIKLSNKSGSPKFIQNLDCFSSDKEDGGVYFPPDLSFELKNNLLFIKYDHGRYGNWQYIFRYQNDNFKLIGYDLNEKRGPIITNKTSINFSTNKMLVSKNITPDNTKNPVFEEKMTEVNPKLIFNLKEIKDFDNLSIISNASKTFGEKRRINAKISEEFKAILSEKSASEGQVDFFEEGLILGNMSTVFQCQLYFDNIYDAISTLKQLNMFEIDDYFIEETPISSTRKIDFDIKQESSNIIANVSLNNKQLSLTPNNNQTNDIKKEYSYPTSETHYYTYEGEKNSYSDMLYFDLTFDNNELIEFGVRSSLNGFLSDDELMSLNPDNQLTIEELRKLDKNNENSISGICNGYTSEVKISKQHNNSYLVSFSASTHACAL
mgnify:CR=1 FL=1